MTAHPVRLTDHPATDRYVTLTPVRLLGRDYLLLAILDGSSRPTDDAQPRLYPTDQEPAARKAANRLVAQFGGVASRPLNYYLLPRRKPGPVESAGAAVRRYHERTRKAS